MPPIPENTYPQISALFLRLLASIGIQIKGLAGSQGIIPIAERLKKRGR